MASPRVRGGPGSGTDARIPVITLRCQLAMEQKTAAIAVEAAGRPFVSHAA